MLWLRLCTQTNICMSILLPVSLRKSTIQFLVFFTFFINFLMKTLIKSIIYCQTMPLDYLLRYVAKIVSEATLPSSSTWVSPAIFVLENAEWKLSVLLSSIVNGRRDKSLVHVNELHPALKSVHGKSQSVIAGKLFSSIGQCLAQGVFSRFRKKLLELLLWSTCPGRIIYHISR